MEILRAKVEKLLITQPFDALPVKTEKLSLCLDGIKYDRHYGRNNLSDVRFAKLLERGHEVANIRQVTIVSSEELDEISKEIGFIVQPEDLEANITLSGVKDLTKLPAGTFIKFPRKAILYVTAENLPCVIPAQHMMARGEEKAKAVKFSKVAMGKRGITAFVYCAGFIKTGDEAEIYKPQSFE